jgi:hypothetical protein
MCEEDGWRTNRVRKTEPSANRAGWCDRCDRNLIRRFDRHVRLPWWPTFTAAK